MSNISRQIVAVFAFVLLGPLLMITTMKYADVVNYELKEAKEEELDD
jgi:hypothetical protein